MSKLKETLNLPHTDFPMRANLPAREPGILATWEAVGLYQQVRAERADAKQFILHDGPPYANGDIHIGHAVNKVIKDIIVKSRLLSGFDVPYVPGWDCHGLPIELEVEKKYRKETKPVSPQIFRQRCREYAEQQIKQQMEGFIRLGVLGDWKQPYKSMDYKTEANILRVLARTIKRGYFYHGMRPVLWCLDCESSLAEAEVEYKNKNSVSIDCLFRLADAKSSPLPQQLTSALGAAAKKPLAVAVWTTTAWTLPVNQAVAFHPQYRYVVVDTERCQVFVAQELLPAWLERCGITEHRVVAEVQGEQLIGASLQHPFYEHTVPLLPATFVTLDAGSGFVHIAPAHGVDDFHVGKKQGLECASQVSGRGVFSQDVSGLEGVSINACTEQIVTLLQQKDNLLCAQKHEHSYPHCWRHKTPVIYRATTQWFLGMEQASAQHKVTLREQALQACESIQWFPAWGKSRMQGMLQDRPDWCLSRQRKWGVPIAVFVHKKTKALHPNTPALMEQVARAIERDGVEAWFEIKSRDLIGQEAQEYEKVEDVLDVWFDSGSTCGSVLRVREELRAPADLYLEGSDQHRGWFQSSLLTSLAAYGEVPYQGILTHGFVVDAHGMKMSKSRGNVIAPDEVINKLGADILRLWVAGTDFSGEMVISPDILQHTAEAYRRIRNTARFLLGNLYDFDAQKDLLKGEQLLALDAWVIVEAMELQQQLCQEYTSYQFHQIYQRIHHFCNITLGGFYLDIVKDRLYTTQADSFIRRSSQTALFYLVQALSRWIAPILSFTAEEIYQKILEIPGEKKDSIFLCQWYPAFDQNLKKHMRLSSDQWDDVIALRQSIMKHLETLRQRGDIGSSLNADLLLFCASPQKAEVLEKIGDEMRFILLTSTFELCAEAPPSSVEIEPGVWLSANASQARKCQRCWHQRAEVGVVDPNRDLCMRCLDNLEGEGEKRQYA